MLCMRLHLPRHQALHVVPGYQLLRLRPVRKGWRKIQTMSLVKNVYLWMALSYIWKPPEFSIKHFFKHFDVEFSKHVVPLTFSPTAPAEPTPPGGPCGPCGCKQESLREKKQDKSYATELLVWLVWLKKKLTTVPPGPWGPLGPGGPGGPCKAFICISYWASLRTCPSFHSHVCTRVGKIQFVQAKYTQTNKPVRTVKAN